MKKLNIKKKYNKIFGFLVARILGFVGHIYFGEKIEGKENIPKSGKCIIAGNHLSNFDAYILFRSTNRFIYILGKKELFTKYFGWFFRLMGVIPVDRSKKNDEVREYVYELLNNENVIGIFPEGTYHKKDRLLPFKPGVIDFALKTGAPIIPFGMVSTFKFRCHPLVKFGKPIYINEIKEKDKVKYLENIIENIIIDLENKKNVKK